MNDILIRSWSVAQAHAYNFTPPLPHLCFMSEWWWCEASPKYDVVLALQVVMYLVPFSGQGVKPIDLFQEQSCSLSFHVRGRIGIASKLSELVPEVLRLCLEVNIVVCEEGEWHS